MDINVRYEMWTQCKSYFAPKCTVAVRMFGLIRNAQKIFSQEAQDRRGDKHEM